MKTLMTATIVLSLLVLGGCPSEQMDQASGLTNTATKDGLSVRLELPMRNLYWGQSVTATVVATNTSGRAITVQRPTQAPVLVKVWRHTVAGLEEVKRLPAASVMVAGTWKLEPGASRTFTLELPVERDWPTGEPLRITAELNGRPDVMAGGVIQVFSTQKECQRASVY
jgi:hypothetical protein